VFFPAECAPAANLLVAMSQSAIEATILVGILIVVGNASVTMLLVPVLLILLAVFSFGVGLVLSVANVYYRDVNYLVAVLLNLLFYATPIVYPESLVKDRGPLFIQIAVAINPLYHFVRVIRDSVYLLVWPSAAEMAVLVGFSIGTFLLGWLVFHHFGNRISEEI
jgi:ABC-2 type transport system permease protein